MKLVWTFIISFAIKKQCHVTIEIFFINRIFDIFIYLQIIFYRNGGGKMDEITVGPRHYPPTLWYNVIEIHYWCSIDACYTEITDTVSPNIEKHKQDRKVFFSCKIMGPSIVHRLLTVATSVGYLWVSEQPVVSVTGDSWCYLSPL